MYYHWGFNENYHKSHTVDGPLGVVSAGYIQVAYNSRTDRPEGLGDWQLLWVRSGRLRLEGRSDGVSELTAGQGVLFRLGEPQVYRYSEDECTESCWVHFGGSDAPALVERLGLGEFHLGKLWDSREMESGVRQLVRELQQKDFAFEEKANALLVSILVALARGQRTGGLPAGETAIKAICGKMQTEYMLRVSNAEYAARCGVSLPHFLRSFHSVTGTSPQQYVLDLRMQAAKELLLDTDYPVERISAMIGIDDPLYFSRVFKKHQGVSPTAYRKAGRLN